MNKLVLGFLFILVIIGCKNVEPKVKQEIGAQPNVIIIMVDTLRADHTGCYGYEKNTTPNIDKLAEDGEVIEQFYSTSSWTMPAVMSLFTGLYPVNHRTTNYSTRLPDEIPTIAQILKDNGYSTKGIVSNVTVNSIFGFDKGFDSYDDETYRMVNEMRAVSIESSTDSVEPHAYITSPIITRIAKDWLANREDKSPFFMYIHYTDPHFSYIPPPPYDKEFDNNYIGELTGWEIKDNPDLPDNVTKRDWEHLVALYDGEIKWTDKHIGEFIEQVKAQGLYDNSIIIVLGDHGEEFGEHGGIAHGETLYQEAVLVPCIYKGASFSKQSSFRATGSIVDLAPTILEQTGCPKAVSDGVSLTDLKPAENALLLETRVFGKKSALIKEGFKYITDDSSNIVEIYNLKTDSEEKNNLINKVPNGLGDAVKILEGLYNKSGIDIPNALNLSGKVKTDLKASGYMDKDD